MRTRSPVGALLSRVAIPFTAEEVFDCLSGVVYFVKNARAEYVVVNRTLAERCGTADKNELLGKTAAQAFPPPLGQSFYDQDRKLLDGHGTFRNQLELHIYPTGATGWCLTDKFPLCDADGAIVGLVGVSQDLHQPDESVSDYEGVAAALRYARKRLATRPVAADLAAVAGLSPFQLDQRIRRIFHLTTGQLLLKLRMELAVEKLNETDEPIAQIGLACGYSDQSAFARQFRETTGLTPGEYRRGLRTSHTRDR